MKSGINLYISKHDIDFIRNALYKAINFTYLKDEDKKILKTLYEEITIRAYR